jgi:MFS-type transporter involved in bile tolerance (Atg22 family)
MNQMIAKSIGAVVAGLVFIGVSHTATDAILESAGVLPKGHLNVDAVLILLVIFYRAVLSLVGCYLTAWLAPRNPMKHSLILGAIGIVLSAIGAIATADMNLGPAWYAWSLVVIALPTAWVGGYLFVRAQMRKAVQRTV